MVPLKSKRVRTATVWITRTELKWNLLIMADSTRTAFTKSCRGEVNGSCVFVKNLYQNKTVFTFEKKIFELKGDGHRVPFDWSTFDKSKKYVQLTSGQLQRVAVLDRAGK